MASRVLGALAVTATAALASLALATPASAHTPKWDASCDENGKVTKVWVKLTQYNDRGKNTVVVKDVVNGVEKELPLDNKNGEFSTSFYKEWNDLDATVKHDFKLVVKAWDGYNFEDKKTVQPCVKTPPATTTKPVQQKPPATTTEAPSSSATSSTPAAPAPGGSTPEPPLAATGASPMWLLLSGLGLVGAGAGTLLFLRRRRSA